MPASQKDKLEELVEQSSAEFFALFKACTQVDLLYTENEEEANAKYAEFMAQQEQCLRPEELYHLQWKVLLEEGYVHAPDQDMPAIHHELLKSIELAPQKIQDQDEETNSFNLGKAIGLAENYFGEAAEYLATKRSKKCDPLELLALLCHYAESIKLDPAQEKFLNSMKGPIAEFKASDREEHYHGQGLYVLQEFYNFLQIEETAN